MEKRANQQRPSPEGGSFHSFVEAARTSSGRRPPTCGCVTYAFTRGTAESYEMVLVLGLGSCCFCGKTRYHVIQVRVGFDSAGPRRPTLPLPSEAESSCSRQRDLKF